MLETYSEPCQGTKMERVVKIINGFHLMTFFAKRSILDPLQGAKYASEYYIALRKLNILQN